MQVASEGQYRAGWEVQVDRVPATRYQGSKRRLLTWIGGELERLQFDTALDLFSGTASVSYLLKSMGKRVTSNDLLDFNREIARALVVNENKRLAPAKLEGIGAESPGQSYERLIEEEFAGVFYLDEENRWLDRAIQNLERELSGSERSLALYALFQSCLSKRPYNLFHRANLSMRTAEVERSFGNKKTWDRPFEKHLEKHLLCANAAVFESGRVHQAVSTDYRDVEGSFDLVYIDPPYTPGRGRGVDYCDFYHFLEGLMDYGGWRSRIERTRPHRPLTTDLPNPWSQPEQLQSAFAEVFDRYRDSILVVSYREDGRPRVDEIASLLMASGRKSPLVRRRPHQYALSPKRSAEVLIISAP